GRRRRRRGRRGPGCGVGEAASWLGRAGHGFDGVGRCRHWRVGGGHRGGDAGRRAAPGRGRSVRRRRGRCRRRGDAHELRGGRSTGRWLRPAGGWTRAPGGRWGRGPPAPPLPLPLPSLPHGIAVLPAEVRYTSAGRTGYLVWEAPLHQFMIGFGSGGYLAVS